MDYQARGWVSYGPGPQAGQAGPADLTPEWADLRRLGARVVRGAVRAARKEEPGTTLGSMLHEHLAVHGGQVQGGQDVVVVEETWPGYEQVNVQAGLDAWLAERGRTHEIVGVAGYQHRQFGLADLLADGPQQPEPFGLLPGHVARANLACGPDGQTLACVKCALYLVDDQVDDQADDDGVAGGGGRLAMLVRGADPDLGQNSTTVQIAAVDPGHGAAVAARLRGLAMEQNVFRGHVLSFGGEMFGHGQTILQFHRRPRVDAQDVILPEGVLGAIRRQVVEVARYRQQLLAAGQHLKRGLLLYGPPGVGKTHTVRYLTSVSGDTTVIQLTGDALHLISQACSVARALQPAMVIVEDVDLIAEDRGAHPGHHPLLFQLLNEMDGLAEDADVVFVLTTNRADLLEPALAARPGRVDQAVELPLPDASARRRLLDLYCGRLEVDVSRIEGVIARTDGTTASFLKELLRRAALVAAAAQPDPGAPGPGVTEPLRVSADHLDTALSELMDTRNAMTRVLLGSATEDHQ